MPGVPAPGAPGVDAQERGRTFPGNHTSMDGDARVIDDEAGRLSAAEAAIRDAEAAYDRAWDAADVDGLVAPFVAGATLIDPFGNVVTGSDEIRRALSGLLAGRASGSTHAGTILGVRFVTQDVALADGEAVITGLTGPAGEPLPPLTHRFTDVFVLRGGVWRISQIRAYVLMPGRGPLETA
jgi:uncharacterized protein (TIGR02246 family)